MKVEKIIISKDGKYYSGKVSKGVNNLDAINEFPTEIECHAGKGIVGDRFYNYKFDFNGQVTFFGLEFHEKLEKHLGKPFSIEHYRRNIFVTGLDPLSLLGKEFQVGDVTFFGAENCAPCKFMNQYIGQGALAWMREHDSGGLRAKVVSSGKLQIGDKLL